MRLGLLPHPINNFLRRADERPPEPMAHSAKCDRAAASNQLLFNQDEINNFYLYYPCASAYHFFRGV